MNDNAPVAPLDTDVELVRAFLNTCNFEIQTDVLNDTEQWRRWCAERGLGTVPDRTSAREIRDRMRGWLEGRRAPAPAWPLRVRLPVGVPVLTGDDALGSVLAAAVRLVHTGHWDRLKICPAQDCRWVFYDRSRNRSRTWCAMRVCGNREKARTWRERHAS